MTTLACRPGSAAATRHTVAIVFLVGALGALAALTAAPARAADQPIAGRTLRIKQTAAGARLLFLSKDPAVPFPAIGSDDDPASASPGGIVVEVFSQTEGAHTLSAPPGIGKPGWTVSDGKKYDAYRYRNPAGPAVSRLRQVALVEGRRLKVHGDAGLALDGPLGAVAIRVRTGLQWSCALFAGAAVRRDEAGSFVARNAPAPALPDCSDASLLGALGFDCGAAIGPACGGTCPGDGVCAADPTANSTCRCVSSTQPCGSENAPLCNGECPAGEQCWPIDNFIPGAVNDCVCAPVGEPPCGTTGICGGACPADLVCLTIPPSTPIFDPACNCVEEQTCGPGFGVCPPELECHPVPGDQFSCIPIFCDGAYPACGGACGGGRTCVPLDIAGTGFCACATPERSCDEGLACGEGLACPSGEVCTFTPGSGGGDPSCTCEPL